MDFGDGLPGDHRTLWVDIPKRIIFGHNPPNLFKRDDPMLTCKDHRIYNKYNDRVETMMEEQHFPSATAALRRAVKEKQVTLAKSIWNNLWKKYEKIIVKALVKLRKRRMGKHPWSPRYQRLRDERLLWTLVVKRIRHKRRNIKKLKILMNKLGILDALKVNRIQAQKCRDQAHKLCKQAEKKEVKHWRKCHLAGLADALAMERDDVQAENQIMKGIEQDGVELKGKKRIKAATKLLKSLKTHEKQ